MRLHHVALGAVDVEQTAAFYRSVFRLAELARHLDDAGRLRSIWLDMQPGILMVERSERARTRVEGIGGGPFLLAFAIAADEREYCESRALAAGASIESRSAWTSYFRDPEGNRVALSHHGVESSRPPHAAGVPRE